MPADDFLSDVEQGKKGDNLMGRDGLGGATSGWIQSDLKAH